MPRVESTGLVVGDGAGEKVNQLNIVLPCVRLRAGTGFSWCFSLTKPLVLPGVNKKALANKIRFEVVDVIEKTENIELSESFLMGKKKCFEAVSREYAMRSRVQVLPVYGLRGE